MAKEDQKKIQRVSYQNYFAGGNFYSVVLGFTGALKKVFRRDVRK